jgi:hypothetical protein
MRNTAWRSVGTLFFSFVTLSCTASTNPPLEVDTSPPKLIILIYGFFKSEDSEKFDPKRLRYGLLDLREAHDAIVEKARSLDWLGSIHVLSWAESIAVVDRPFSEAERVLLRNRRSDALDVLDSAVHARQVPVEKAVKLKAPFIRSEAWRAEDRILAIVGLETVRRPDRRAPTAFLGCFWFSGEASYLDLLVAPYDATEFGTAELAATVSNRCFRLPRGKVTQFEQSG